MFFKLCSILAVCIFGISCDEAKTLAEDVIMTTCQRFMAIQPNRPNELDYFLKHAKFEAKIEQVNKCVFDCFAKLLYGKFFHSISQATQVTETELKDILAETSKKMKSLDLQFSEAVLNSCSPKGNFKARDLCNPIYNFFKCAVDLKNRSLAKTHSLWKLQLCT